MGRLPRGQAVGPAMDPCVPKTLALHSLLEGRSSKCSEGDEVMRPRARSPGKKDEHLETSSSEKTLGKQSCTRKPKRLSREAWTSGSELARRAFSGRCCKHRRSWGPEWPRGAEGPPGRARLGLPATVLKAPGPRSQVSSTAWDGPEGLRVSTPQGGQVPSAGVSRGPASLQVIANSGEVSSKPLSGGPRSGSPGTPAWAARLHPLLYTISSVCLSHSLTPVGACAP